MALNAVLGEIQCPTGGWAFSVNAGGGGGPIAKTLPAGSYYAKSATAGESLVTAFDDLVDDVAASVTVTFSSTTGRYTITNAHATDTCTITWTDTALRDALGFSGATTAVAALTSSTGAAQGEMIWLPNVEPSDLSGYLGSKGRRIEDVAVAITRSGGYVRTRGSNRWRQELGFRGLSAAKTWVGAETLVNESLEQFWIDCLHAGLRVRHLLDRSTTDYVQSIEFRCASLQLEPTPTVSGSHAWWDVALELVPADET